MRLHTSARFGLLQRSESIAGLGSVRLKPGQAAYEPLPVNTLNANGLGNDPGCYATITPAYNAYGVSNLADRESVVNLHIGVPHRHDAGRDDIQVLYNVVALQTQFVSSQNDLGPNVITELSQYETGQSIPEVWPDFVTWPSGTHFGQSANGLSPVPYYAPSSPGNRCANIDPYGNYSDFHVAGECAAGTFSAVPPDNRDSFWNNASIFKLQYQHNIGSNAYVRLLRLLVLFRLAAGERAQLRHAVLWIRRPQLRLRTRIPYARPFDDRCRSMSSQHLLTFDANYVSATTNRYNNNNFNNFLSTDRDDADQRKAVLRLLQRHFRGPALYAGAARSV